MTVEYKLPESGDDPLLGVLLGLQRALWVPVNAHKLLRGLILVGSRNKEKSLPRAIVEQIASQLALLMEFEDERCLSAKREEDLTLWRYVQACLNSQPISQIVLKTLVESCTKQQGTGNVGALFALIGKHEGNLPVSSSAATQESQLLVLAASGDPAWAHSLEHGPLEALWKQSMREGRVVGTDPQHLPLAKDLSRVVAIPIENKKQVHGVLLAGIPRCCNALEVLERLELRALLVAQVMEVQRLAEAELRDMAWQRALLDSSVESVLLVDQQGLLHGMSKGAKDLFRGRESYTDSSPDLQQRLAELFRPRDWERVSGWVNRELDGSNGEPSQTLKAELWTGTAARIRRLAISQHGFLVLHIQASRPPGFTRIVKDVESELHQTLEWLQEGVAIFDQQGGIRALNSRCRQILGITAERTQDIRNFEELLARVSMNAADPVNFAANWRALASQGGTESQEELAMEWPAPQLIERSSRQITDENGDPLGRVEVYQELTARKIFHSRMLQAEKMASLGQRATGIVHELANPLTTILGNAQRLVLRDPVAGTTPEVVRILEEADRASSILRQLLSLSREAQPLRRRVSLHELAERTVALQKVALHNCSIELRLESDGSLPPIDGDFAQLQQVLLNLLQNAQQAILQSGQGSTIVVRTESAGNERVRLEVWDNGPGIPPALQGRIYDPFFTTKAPGAGTGLGLSIALGFVRQNGGTLTYLSPKQGGSRFVMEFPLAEGCAAPRQPLALPVSKPEHLKPPVEPLAAVGLGRSLETARRVLVLEDEPTVAALIADALRDGGLRVDVVLDSASALQQIERESYDLLICDLKMPGIDGQEFYRAMLGRHHPMREKILFVTGDVVAPRSQEFLARHRLPHVAKPFRMDELMSAVQQLLAAGQALEAVKAVASPRFVSGNG